MSSVIASQLLDSPSLSLRDIRCDGACKHRSPTECATSTAIVFAYRGTFVRHLGRDEAIADGNQVLFFNAGQEYSISHPVAGGDACLSLAVDDELMREIVPTSKIERGSRLVFREQRARIDPSIQTIIAQLRQRLRSGAMEPLQGETLSLSLIRSAVVNGRLPEGRRRVGKRKLVDRVKLVLMADPGRRWTLSEIGKEVGCSPVYLTQVFQQIEGMPLYRYQLRLRLAKAMQDLGKYDDLTMLALDLGFSSHSHFSTVFRATYGDNPSAFRSKFRSNS
jgi:AraC-like DNA-binding protein